MPTPNMITMLGVGIFVFISIKTSMLLLRKTTLRIAENTHSTMVDPEEFIYEVIIVVFFFQKIKCMSIDCIELCFRNAIAGHHNVPAKSNSVMLHSLCILLRYLTKSLITDRCKLLYYN